MANEHDGELVPVLADAERHQLAKLGVAALPALVQRAGPEGWRAFLNFFGASIENDNTRAAYLKAVCEFLEECDDSGLEELADIEPFIVGAYVQHLQKVRELSKPTVKLKLVALRRFFDHLVVNQVLPKSPADAVRGPKVQVGRGKTPPRRILCDRRPRGHDGDCGMITGSPDGPCREPPPSKGIGLRRMVIRTSRSVDGPGNASYWGSAESFACGAAPDCCLK